MSIGAERIAKTEALFRNVDEGIAEASSGSRKSTAWSQGSPAG